MRAIRDAVPPARWWRHRRLWVKLVALTMVPLVTAGALAVALVESRLRNTDNAWRIAQHAEVTGEAFTVGDEAYFDGYVLAARASLGPTINKAPPVAKVIDDDTAQLEAELRSDVQTIQGSPTLASTLDGLVPRITALVNQQARGSLSSSILSADFLRLGDSVYNVAEDGLGTINTEAATLPGSTLLSSQIQTTTQLDAVAADAEQVLVSMFDAISTPLGVPRAKLQGVIGSQASRVETDLTHLYSSPVGLSSAVIANAKEMNTLAVAAASWDSDPINAAVPLTQIEHLGPVANSFAAGAVVANYTQMTAIGSTAADIRRQAVRSAEMTIGATALLALFTLALTLVIYRGLRRPMKALADRARQITNGSLESGQESGSREIEEISLALNDAIRNLSQLKAQSEALGTGDLANPVLKQPVPGRLGEAMFASVLQTSELQRQLGYRATHDPLTGLLNREAANEALESALTAGRNSNTPVGAAFIDLDGFKQMNDNYGHAFGDQVLQVTADRLAVQAGETDLVCRIGGDEFLLVIRDASDAASVDALTRRIQLAIRQPISVGQGEVRLGASVGIAISDPGQPYDASQLLREADVAVYKAKTMGRNQVRTFDEISRQEGKAHVDLDEDLRRALEGGQLALHYQPMVRVMGGDIWGFEALLRWNRDGQEMATREVIAVAENTDLIIDLDRWVLDQACAELAHWSAHPGFETARISVNISGRHLGRNLLAADVLQAVRSHDVKPENLMIEVAETALVGDSEAARLELSRLREAGVAIVIDNFGTGHSSIAQLSQFPADLLKIDREFLEPVPGFGEREVIIGLIIGAAHAMKMTVVAAGVEHEDQMAMLRDLGCEVAQGHMIARPMPVTRVPGWVEEWNGAERTPPETLASALLSAMVRDTSNH